jgi:YVTN family beta-propeller protein
MRLLAVLAALGFVVGAAPAVAAPFAYVPNHGDGTVSVIDTATNQVAATVTVGSQPLGAAVNPSLPHVYVSNQLAPNGTVSVIDTGINGVVATVDVGAGPSGVAVKLPGDRVYVTNRDDKTVSVVDALLRTEIDTIDVGNNPLGIAINPAGTPAYVVNNGSNSVSVVDTTTNVVIGTVPVGNDPTHVAVSPNGRHVYVTNGSNASVSVIDTAFNTVVKTVDVGNKPEGVTVDPTGARVYVANSGPNSVAVIDTAQQVVVATVPVGFEPFELAVRPDGGAVLVSNRQGGSVSVIDTTQNAVTATVEVGFSPAGFGQFLNPGLAAPRFGKVARKCQVTLGQRAARLAKADLALLTTCELARVNAEVGLATTDPACSTALDVGDPKSKRARARAAARKAIDKACAAVLPVQINGPCSRAATAIAGTEDCVVAQHATRVAEMVTSTFSATRPVLLDPAARVCQAALATSGKRFADQLHTQLVRCLSGVLAARDAGRGDAKAALNCRRALTFGDPKSRVAKARATAVKAMVGKCAGRAPADLGSPCDAMATTIGATVECLLDAHTRRVGKMVAAEFNDACSMVTAAGVGLAQPAVCTGP